MRTEWWHMLLIVIIGIAIDYFFPGIANATIGKLGVARK